jgi:hypothetical protein
LRPALFLVLGLLCGAAAAQTSPFVRNSDAVPTQVTPDQNSGIAVAGARLTLPGSSQLGFLLDLNDGNLAYQQGGEKLGAFLPFRIDAHLFAAATLSEHLEVAADMPFTLHQGEGFQVLGQQGVLEPGVSAAGLGDLRLLARVAPLARPLPLGFWGVLTGELRMPTGDGQSASGEGGWRVGSGVALEHAVGPLVRVLFNAGARLRLETPTVSSAIGHELTAGLSAVIRLPPFWKLHDPRAIFEANLATPLTRPLHLNDRETQRTAWDAMTGLRANLSPRWTVELDAGRGITYQRGYGREAFRMVGAIRYTFGSHP